MEYTVSVENEFWTSPALGFQVIEPICGSKLSRWAQQLRQLVTKDKSIFTRLSLPKIRRGEMVILLSGTLVQYLEQKGFALWLPEGFKKRTKGEYLFYYYIVPQYRMLDSVSEKSALAKAQHRIVLHKQAVALIRFDITAALLLNSLMSEPAEPGVTPELRMREVSALLRSAKFAEPDYVLDAALTALCGQELDSSMKTDWFKQQIVELQVKNGWVKQF